MKHDIPKFAANLTMMFPEVPFLDRFERAARAGFETVEFLFPYAFPAHEIRARLDAHGLKLVLHNLPAGDWDAGERGIACHPDRTAEFRAGVGRAIEFAMMLGVPRLNCLAGKAPAGVDEATLRETFVTNLRYASAELKKANLMLLIEPINVYDIPGFYLNRSAQALAILDEVGADNALLQYDLYHAQCTEGEFAGTLHRQLSAHRPHPARRQPGPARGRAPARSTSASCSRTSTASAGVAGSAASTSPLPPPPPALAGASGWRPDRVSTTNHDSLPPLSSASSDSASWALTTSSMSAGEGWQACSRQREQRKADPAWAVPAKV